MDQHRPMLLEFIFGEAAETAQRGASERLLRWSEAFEGWMGERESKYKAEAVKKAKLAWRRLLRQCGKMPWELEPADIEGQAEWMEAEGYAASSIANAIGFFSSFFEWCKEQEIEAGVGNPAAEVKRPKVRRYDGAQLLSEQEVRALLGILRQDETPLGKRDYAFFLSRLSYGAPLGAIRELRWGEVMQKRKFNLPEEARAAMVRYLEASGRLAGMSAEKYVFAPLAFSGKGATGSKAEDWREDRPLASRTILDSLKIYGKAAGIAEERLNLMALRRTAVRLRLAAGDSLEEVHDFLDNRGEKKFTKYRLGRLPELPEGGNMVEKQTWELPVRRAKPFKPGDGLKHGMYANSLSREILEAIMAEGSDPIEEMIVGMRTLERGLFERYLLIETRKDKVDLAQAYSLASKRLGDMIRYEKLLAEKNNDPEGEEFLAAMDRIAIAEGKEPVSDSYRAEIFGGAPEMTINDRRMAEEVAALRFVLRNLLEMALEAEGTGEYIKLAEIYSMAGNRLMRIMRQEGGKAGEISAYVQKCMDAALKELKEEGFMR